MNSTPLATDKRASFARRGSRILAATTVAALTLGASLVMAPAASAAGTTGTVNGDVLIGGQPAASGTVYLSSQSNDYFTPVEVVDGTFEVTDVPVGDDYDVSLSATDPADEYGTISEYYESNPETGGGVPQTVSADSTTEFDFSTKYNLSMNYDEAFPEDAQVGDTLTITPGTWQNAGVTSSIQWFSHDKPIAGATGTSFVVKPEYAGGYISVEQTGTKANANNYNTSSYTGSWYLEGKDFTTQGDAEIDNLAPAVGDVLTMNVMKQSKPASASYSYLWYVNNEEYATSKSIAVTEDLVGTTIDGYVIFELPGYTSDYVYAGATEPVTGPKLTTSSKLTATGTAKAGSTLTASDIVWDQQGATIAYQWYYSYGKSGAYEIFGATGKSFKVAASWAGYALSVRATGSLEGFGDTTLVSASTKTVPYLGTIKAKTPKLTGTFKVGKTIKVSVGSWSPKGLTYDYVWKLNGKAYTQTAKGSFKLPKAAKGKKVTVTVGGYKDGYKYVAKTSKSSAKVK